MSFQVVSERLVALQESNAQLKQIIERLATINFQPGSVPLDTDDGNVMTELTAEIQQMLKDQDEDLELLQEDINDLPRKPGTELHQQGEWLDQHAKRAALELKGCETSFRRAQLSARRRLEEAQRQERELLLQSYTSEPSSPSSPGAIPLQQRLRRTPTELSKEEREVNATSDVTAALRRTHDMMASELSRSQFAHDTLKESTAALSQLSETYSTLDTLLSSSRNLLGTLLRSQKSDTWYLETAFYVLLTTIVWLVFRRILYGPLWWITWLMWFPVKIFIRSFLGVLAAVGITGGSSAVEVASSAVASSTLIVHSSATGRLSAPSMAGGRAPSVNVGGGGKGAPMPSNVPKKEDPSQGNVSEQVGRIIDESRDEHATNEGEKKDITVDGDQNDSQPNPKKRMWEEEKEAVKEAERQKDEL